MNISSLPLNPGVYLFKDKSGTIIYVGKAKSLKKRVGSYFSKSEKSPKTEILVSHIKDIETIIVNNEVEALLLENRLIKQHKPRYNILLKDNRTYAYLHLSADSFPKLETTRKVGKKGHYFGPFVSGDKRRELQQLTQKLFKLRVCKTLPKKACLNYHICLCTAPCIKAVSKEEYETQVKGAKKFLEGDSKEILNTLKKEMVDYSKQQQYEIALEKKKQIEAVEILTTRQAVDRIESFDQDVIVIQPLGQKTIIEVLSIKKGVLLGRKEFKFEPQDDLLEQFLKLYYSQTTIPREIILNTTIEDTKAIKSYLEQLRGGKVDLTVAQRGEKKRLVEIALKNITLEDQRLVQLQEKLLLPSIPRIIECFDISNLGSDIIVAGMTRWVDPKPDKDGYRRFEIKSITQQDDFASMREVVYRRYHRLHHENAQMPDLIVIDGGEGQLNSALWSLKKLGLQIPIISLAKQDEEIYLPNTPVPLRFDKKSPMMLLLCAIRDSVHNYSISYNRQKRKL